MKAKKMRPPGGTADNNPPADKPRKRNIIVAYQASERPMQEEPPEVQLFNCGYYVTVTEYYDFIKPTLGDVHSTDILLADSVLRKNPSDRTTYMYRNGLANIARASKLKGIGILTDDESLCPTFNGFENGIAVVVSKACHAYNIRDWLRLLEMVKSRIAKGPGPDPGAKSKKPPPAEEA